MAKDKGLRRMIHGAAVIEELGGSTLVSTLRCSIECTVDPGCSSDGDANTAAIGWRRPNQRLMPGGRRSRPARRTVRCCSPRRRSVGHPRWPARSARRLLGPSSGKRQLVAMPGPPLAISSLPSDPLLDLEHATVGPLQVWRTRISTSSKAYARATNFNRTSGFSMPSGGSYYRPQRVPSRRSDAGGLVSSCRSSLSTRRAEVTVRWRR